MTQNRPLACDPLGDNKVSGTAFHDMPGKFCKIDWFNFKGLQQGLNELSAWSPQGPSTWRLECFFAMKASYLYHTPWNGTKKLTPQAVANVRPSTSWGKRNEIREMIKKINKKEESVLSTALQYPLSLCCSSPVGLLSSGVWQSFTDGHPMLGSRVLQWKDLGKVRGTRCFRIFSQGVNSVKRWLLLFPH